MLKQFTKQKIESELSLFDKTNDPPPIQWPTPTTGHHPRDAASLDERTPPRTGSSCPWRHRPSLPRFLFSWIFVFGQKGHFTLLLLVWKRFSPRESVWPTLSLPSLSFLPPLPHNLSGLSSATWWQIAWGEWLRPPWCWWGSGCSGWWFSHCNAYYWPLIDFHNAMHILNNY